MGDLGIPTAMGVVGGQGGMEEKKYFASIYVGYLDGTRGAFPRARLY